MVEPDLARLQITNNFHIELLNHNVNMIMQSQLLTDDDQEIIAAYWSPLGIDVRRNHLMWVNSAISLSGTMVGIIWKSWQLVVTSCIPMGLKTIYDCYNGLRLRKHKRCFKKLIFLLKEQYNLNRLIFEHFQKRTNALTALSDRLRSDFILTLIRKQEKEFADLANDNILQICLEIKKNLHDLNTNLGLDEKNYNLMCSWDFELELETFIRLSLDRQLVRWDETSIFKSFDLFSQYHDIYRLLMSSFLSCIGVSMSINIWRDADKFNSVLHNNIPKLSNVIEKYISQTKDCFENLQFCLIEQPTPKRLYFASNAKRSVFIQPLADCICNIQLTYDITRALQQKIFDNQAPNTTEMEAILEDLLKHNRSTSESIEIVIKMNDIVARRAERLPIIIPHSSEPETVKDSVEVIMSINHDDLSNEPQDEEYSLSPSESDGGAEDKSSDQILNLRVSTKELIMCINHQKRDIEELREKLRLFKEKKMIQGNEKFVSNGDDLDNAPSTSYQFLQPTTSKDQASKSLKNNSDGSISLRTPPSEETYESSDSS